MLAAFEVHEDLSLNTFERIDVFEAMAAAGLRLVFRPLKDSALYVPAALGGTAGAIINARHPLPLQRYSGGHEYGHHVFGHGEQADRDTEPRGTGTPLSSEEKLAEAFAAWFLMPPETAELAMERIGPNRPQTAQDAYALALRLGTSFRATCTHLPSLKLASERTATEWRTTVLKTLKQELSATAPPGGWQHDIWVLNERDAQTDLVVRAGDRLLVTLPGWDIAALPAGVTAELLPAETLLSAPRWSLALAPDLDAGPAVIELTDSSSTVRFSLVIERPRWGRYIARERAAR